jgi:tetratricopeptide (TPR) repeat protein
MPAESHDSLCQRARQAIAEGDYEQARKAYLLALAQKADAPDAHYGLATVLFMANDLVNAAHHFKEVTRLDPLRAGAWINLGAVYNRMNHLDDAIQALRRSIQIDSHRAEGFYNLGLAYRRKNHLELAIQAYREAVRVNPRMADAHLNLANIYFEKQQHLQAANHYKLALEARPNWDKAEQGLEETLAAQQATRQAHAPPAPTPEEKTEKRVINFPNIEPTRVLDPATHGQELVVLHKATIESESFGRRFLQILESEIEPALKDLSTCLLKPTSTASELDQCVQKFETAVRNFRSAQRSLQGSIDRVRGLGDKVIKS